MIGGGSPGDGTILAHALDVRKIDRAFVALFDPQAVQQAAAAGIRKTIPMQVGSKSDECHGAPMNRTWVKLGATAKAGDSAVTLGEAVSGWRIGDRVIEKIEYVPDETIELYFKAADVLILPYTHVFQSGVLFLGYSFGLPAIVADVATLKQEIIEGQTGFVFRPQDSFDLASKADEYFKSDLFSNLENTRSQIKQYANDRYSWSKVAEITTAVYSNFLSSR